MSKWGEVKKQNVLVMDTIRVDTELPIDDNPFERCCYELCVFADPIDTDTFKNDWSRVIKIIPTQYTVASIKIQEKVSGTWTDRATLTDDTYGTYYAPGFHTEGNNTYAGYKIDWRSVFNAGWGGRGKYRLAFDLTSTVLYSEEYCLEQFSTVNIDGTVRIEYLWNSLIGSKYSDLTRNFVGLNWWNQIRFKETTFGYSSSEMEESSVRMEDGKERTHKLNWERSFKMIIKRLPLGLHDILLYDIAQADEVKITDYNSWNNSGNAVEQAVKFSGNYDPNYKGTTRQPSVMLSFKDRYTNHKKFYS